MYTKKETENDEGEVTVSYDWETKLGLGDDEGAMAGATYYSQSATLGAYAVSEGSLKLLSNFKKLNLSDYADVEEEAAGVFSGVKAFINGDEVIVRK